MARQSSLVHGNVRDHAWAIWLKGKHAGWAYTANWSAGEVPLCLAGCAVAMFETRSDARVARKSLYGFGPRRVSIRKVQAHLEVLPERPDQRPARLTAQEAKEDADG